MGFGVKWMNFLPSLPFPFLSLESCLSLLSLPSYFLAQFLEWARLWNWSLGHKVVRLCTFSSPLPMNREGHFKIPLQWSYRSWGPIFQKKLVQLRVNSPGFTKNGATKFQILTSHNLQPPARRAPQLTQEIHFSETSDLWNLVSIWRISGTVVCHNQILSPYISSQATTVP